MYCLVVNDEHQTIFTKFSDFFCNCEFYIADTQLHPLICLIDSCHRNQNCADAILKRCRFFFDKFPKSELILTYFRYRDHPKSIRAGVWFKQLLLDDAQFNPLIHSPRLITINPSAFEKMKELGKIYEIHYPTEISGDL